jgi:hypothetical protein
MQLYSKNALITPKGCRVTGLGSPFTPGLCTNHRQAARDQSRPRTKTVGTHGATPMKHRNGGFILPEHASRARLRASLLRVVTGKPRSEKAGFVCWSGPTIEAHATHVTAVTYSDDFTLIMCRYSASSVFELAASSSSGEIRLNLDRVSVALTLPEEPKNKKLNGCSKWQPQIGPIAVKGQVRAGRSAAGPYYPGTHATTG